MQSYSVCLLLFAFVLFFCSPCSAVEIKICDSSAGILHEVYEPACDNPNPICEMKRGMNSTTIIRFTPLKDMAAVKASAFAIIGTVEFPLPVEYPNFCDDPNGGLTCPLKANKEYTYRRAYTVPKTSPRIRIDIKWLVKTLDDEDILCVVMPVQVVRGDDED